MDKSGTNLGRGDAFASLLRASFFNKNALFYCAAYEEVNDFWSLIHMKKKSWK